MNRDTAIGLLRRTRLPITVPSTSVKEETDVTAGTDSHPDDPLTFCECGHQPRPTSRMQLLLVAAHRYRAHPPHGGSWHQPPGIGWYAPGQQRQTAHAPCAFADLDGVLARVRRLPRADRRTGSPARRAAGSGAARASGTAVRARRPGPVLSSAPAARSGRSRRRRGRRGKPCDQ